MSPGLCEHTAPPCHFRGCKAMSPSLSSPKAAAFPGPLLSMTQHGTKMWQETSYAQTLWVFPFKCSQDQL